MMNKNMQNVRNFAKQNDRKPIDSFTNLNESRFEPIQKSPQNLSNVKKVTGLSFQAYKERGNIFPEGDQTTFYDANKEFTMKALAKGNLPWQRMTKREVVSKVQQETPEDSFDPMKAVEAKTVRNKPRQIVLANFGKQ